MAIVWKELGASELKVIGFIPYNSNSTITTDKDCIIVAIGHATSSSASQNHAKVTVDAGTLTQMPFNTSTYNNTYITERLYSLKTNGNTVTIKPSAGSYTHVIVIG